MGGFKVRLVAYFVLLSLLPVAAAFWGFSALARQDRTGRLDTRLEAELRPTVASYREQVAGAQATATQLARRGDLERLLERKDLHGLTLFLIGHRDVAVILPNGTRVGRPAPALAARGLAQVVTSRGLAGTVVAYRPVDARLAMLLRSRAGLGLGGGVAILRFGRIVASSPHVSGRLSLHGGVPHSTSLGGVGYRAVATGPLREFAGEQIAVLGPLSLVDSANDSTRQRLLLFLVLMLVVVAGAAYIEGRAIVITLQRLVDAVNRFAAGKLGERVAVRGRDEFAQLGRAFNDMAGQLETRLAELRAERARLGSAIERIGETLGATHDTDQLLRVLLETTLEATGANSAALVSEHGELLRIGQPGESDQKLELALAAGQTSFGTLILWGARFTEEQRQTANWLVAQAGIALENACLHVIVEEQALVDGLTGLANRRRCEEALAVELARAKRFGTPVAVVLVDLDDFKAINDRFGHAAGDEVLRQVATVLRETIREVDLAGRWGGEEFIVLLPGANTEGAAQLAERVRTEIQVRTQRASDDSWHTSTASFGVASYPTANTVGELFEAADRSLYRAKTRGKNRVEAHR